MAGLANDPTGRGVCRPARARIWRAFGLKPHLVQTWKLPADPQFTGKVRDVAGLCLNPPEKALVLAVDEKSQIQADIRRWINAWNKDPRPFVWTKTADEILGTLKAYCGESATEDSVW